MIESMKISIVLPLELPKDILMDLEQSQNPPANLDKFLQYLFGGSSHIFKLASALQLATPAALCTSTVLELSEKHSLLLRRLPLEGLNPVRRDGGLVPMGPKPWCSHCQGTE